MSPSGAAFGAAEAVVAPGQGFFVQRTEQKDEALSVSFTSAMQAQTRYGKKTGSRTFTIVVGTKQKMTTRVETIENDDNTTETVEVEVPVVDAEGNYEVEDITEDVVISSYEQDDEEGKAFPLKARTRGSADDELPGLVITARRDSLQSSALVMVRRTGSNDFLPGEDTEVFVTDDQRQVPTVYTLCGRLATAVNTLHELRCLPLGVESETDAPCALTFQGVELLGDSIALYDAREQTLTPIASGHRLTVSSQSTNRYFLVRGLSLDEAAEETHLLITAHERQVSIVASTDEPIVSVRCTDAAGRTVLTAAPQEGRYSFALPSGGVYIIEALTARDRATRKVVVR